MLSVLLVLLWPGVADCWALGALAGWGASACLEVARPWSGPVVPGTWERPVPSVRSEPSGRSEPWSRGRLSTSIILVRKTGYIPVEEEV